MDNTLTVETFDGRFEAFVARPKRDDAPAVVILQEIFGVNAGIRQIAQEMADQGFLAICPDLFWRFEPSLQLSEHGDGNWTKAMAMYERYDLDSGVRDVQATLSVARALKGGSGKVGVMGFCLGGLMTFLTAARCDSDAAVAYYGGGTDRFVAEGAKIARPMLMHLAGADEFIDEDARRTIIQALNPNPNVEIHVYADQNHAFARPGGDHFEPKDAALANGRTQSFFSKHLI